MTRILTAVLISILIGYLLGCSNMAFYLSKLKGIDLRKTGSRNLGTCNTFTSFGFGWSVVVFLHDAGKAALAMFLARLLFPGVSAAVYVAGVAAVIGHVFPFYLRFRGGKGFAAYMGIILMLNWKVGLLVLLLVAVLTLVTNYIVVGTFATVIGYPIYTALISGGLVAVLILCIASAIVIFRHRENLVRLANGTEIGLFHKK